jgi:hypothetical protein
MRRDLTRYCADRAEFSCRLPRHGDAVCAGHQLLFFVNFGVAIGIR